MIVLWFVCEGVDVLVIDINEVVLVWFEVDVECVGGWLVMWWFDVIDVNEVVVFVVSECVFDVLFNCVGYVYYGLIFDCDDDVWVFLLNLNVMLMYWLICVLLFVMFEVGGVLIVNMVLVVLSVKGVLNCFVYGIIKVVVIGLIKVVVVDFVEWGICCNVICLGMIELLLFE